MARKPKHSLFIGRSGAGKSTLMSEVAHKWDGVVFTVDHSITGEGDIEMQWPGVLVRSAEDVQEVLNDQSGKDDVADLSFHYVTELEGPEAAAVPLEVAKQISSAYNADIPILLNVDECQTVMPDKKSESTRAVNPLSWTFQEGRSYNIHAAAGTQDAMELYAPPLKSMRWLYWVGAPTQFQKGWINAYQVPADMDEFPTEWYEWIQLEPRIPWEHVDHGTTKERYGETGQGKDVQVGSSRSAPSWWPF